MRQRDVPRMLAQVVRVHLITKQVGYAHRRGRGLAIGPAPARCLCTRLASKPLTRFLARHCQRKSYMALCTLRPGIHSCTVGMQPPGAGSHSKPCTPRVPLGTAAHACCPCDERPCRTARVTRSSPACSCPDPCGGRCVRLPGHLSAATRATALRLPAAPPLATQPALRARTICPRTSWTRAERTIASQSLAM